MTLPLKKRFINETKPNIYCKHIVFIVNEIIKNYVMRTLYIYIFLVAITLVGCDEPVAESSDATTTSALEVKEAAIEEVKPTEEITESNTEVEPTEETAEKVEPVEKEAKPKKPAKRGARISFANKSFDYGTINQGDKLNREFVFTNTGDSDLIIKNVTVTCGCTQPNYPFVPIKPGKTGKIQVAYNSTGKLGAQRSIITVVTNGYPRRQKLFLDGVVMPPVAKPEPKPEIEEAPVDPNGNVTKGDSIK